MHNFSESCLQKSVHWTKLHTKMCILGEKCTKMLIIFYETEKKKQADAEVWRNGLKNGKGARFVYTDIKLIIYSVSQHYFHT